MHAVWATLFFAFSAHSRPHPKRHERVSRPAMRDAAPFASLSASAPASTPASPSPTRRPPGDAGFETHRVRTGVLLGDIDAVPRGDGDRIPGDGSPGDGAGDAMGCTGDARRRDGDGTGDGPRSPREERFEIRVDRVLSLVDALDARLAELAGSGETGGEATERAAGVRGHLDRLLRSPPWSERTEKTPRS